MLRRVNGGVDGVFRGVWVNTRGVKEGEWGVMVYNRFVYWGCGWECLGVY